MIIQIKFIFIYDNIIVIILSHEYNYILTSSANYIIIIINNIFDMLMSR